MSSTDYLMSFYRRKTFKKIINNNSDVNALRIVLSFGMSIIFLLALPITLLLLPFILAWDFAGAMTEKINEKENDQSFFGSSKWGNFNVDFDSWEKGNNG